MPCIIGLTLFQGVVNAVEIPTRQAFVVRMIEDRADLGNAIALNSSNFNSARLVGPAIGAFVVAAIGEGYCFLVDGLSSIAVIWSLLSMRLTPEERPPATRRLGPELTDGWRYVVQSTPIRNLLIFLAAIGVLSAPYSSLMPLVAGRLLDGETHALGFLMAASGVGALVCAVRLGRSVVGLGRTAALAVGGFGVGCRTGRVAVAVAVTGADGRDQLRPDEQVVATNTNRAHHRR